MGKFTSPSASAHQKALTLYHNAALTSTKVAVATSKRNLHGFIFENTNDVPVYVHFYDAASDDVTVGSTTPTFSIPVPAGGYADRLSDMPIKEMGTALTIACTTSKTGGSGTPSTSILAQLNYK